MKHKCKYFETILKHHVRYCTFCNKRSYNYGDQWTPEISLNQFVQKWTGGMGGCSSDYKKYMKIEVALPFEERSYETWDVMYSITFLQGPHTGKIFEWYASLNEADFHMEVTHKLDFMFSWNRTYKNLEPTNRGK